jgi:hypothetical protein
MVFGGSLSTGYVLFLVNSGVTLQAQARASSLSFKNTVPSKSTSKSRNYFIPLLDLPECAKYSADCDKTDVPKIYVGLVLREMFLLIKPIL